MKLKISLKGGGGINFKGFFLAHGEKFVAGLVGMCVGWMLWQAITIESLEANKQPADLNQLVERAKANIAEPSTAPVQLTSSDPGSIVSGIRDIDTRAYEIRELNPSIWAVNVKRGDPVLFTVEDLEVRGGFGPLAVVDNNPAPIVQAIVPAAPQPAAPARGRAARGAAARGAAARGAPARGAPARGAPAPVRRGVRGRPGAPDAGAFVVPGTSKPELRYWVTIMAKVPLAKQIQAYRAAMAKAEGFTETDEIPVYFAYKVERAEVTGSGEPDWKPIVQPGVNVERIASMSADWVGNPTEVVDGRYIDPLLTFPLPPVVGRGWDARATHSDIPLVGAAVDPQPAAAGDAEKKDAAQKEEEVELFGPAAAAQPLAPVRGGRGAAGARGRGRGAAAARGRGRGVAGARGGRGRGAAVNTTVKNRLFRFFDFEVEPGKTYQYRVQLLLRDPNYQVAPQNLDIAVLDRQAQLPPRQRPFRFTDWSEPSPTVVVPFSGRVLAGPVKSAPPTQVNGEPSVTALIKQVDEKKGFDAAYEFESMRRGSVGNVVAKIDVADPTQGGQITPIESYDLRTATVLLDIRGGQRLAGRSGKLTEPGELLLLSPSGRLLVRNELDDFEEFERYRAAKPVKAAPLEKPALRGRGNPAGRANRPARGRPNPRP